MIGEDYLDSTWSGSWGADAGRWTKDTFGVVGSVRWSHGPDTIGFIHRAGREWNIVDQLKRSGGGVEDVSAGVAALKVARTGDVVRTVRGGDKVVNETRTDGVVSRSGAKPNIVKENICGTGGEDTKGV